MASTCITILVLTLLSVQTEAASMSAKKALAELEKPRNFIEDLSIIDTEINVIDKKMKLTADDQKFEELHDMFVGAISKLSHFLTKRSEDVNVILDWLKTRTERTTAERTAELVTAKTHVLVALHDMRTLIDRVDVDRENLIYPLNPGINDMEKIREIAADFDAKYPPKRLQILAALDNGMNSIKAHITKYGAA